MDSRKAATIALGIGLAVVEVSPPGRVKHMPILFERLRFGLPGSRHDGD